MATAHTLYENKVLENKITDLVNTKLETRSLMTMDYSLAESAGLKKVVNKYTYTGKVEKLAKAAKNTTKGKVTFTPVEYVVNRYQQTYDYNDMDVMQDPMVVDVASAGAATLMANQIKEEYFAELAKISNSHTYDNGTSPNYDTIVDALATLDQEVEDGCLSSWATICGRYSAKTPITRHPGRGKSCIPASSAPSAACPACFRSWSLPKPSTYPIGKRSISLSRKRAPSSRTGTSKPRTTPWYMSVTA